MLPHRGIARNRFLIVSNHSDSYMLFYGRVEARNGMGLMERNKIGIALGGGAARGWAHIGVLKALLKSGLKPSVIAGTSIGAVVGGCHAAGKLDHLEDFVSQLTPRGVFRFLDLDITGGGLISGTRLRRTLDTELEGIQIEDLGDTFVAVATEIGSGREIWLTKGPLVTAIRASYALPGIFRPIQINGRWLMDGAFVNPVPVAVCRAMGANLVIAVNLHHGGISRTALTPLQATSLDPVAPELPPEPPGRRRARMHYPAQPAPSGLQQGQRQQRARHFPRAAGSLQRHPGSHRPRPSRRRSARHHHRAAPIRHGPVRLPQIQDRHRRRL